MTTVQLAELKNLIWFDRVICIYPLFGQDLKVLLEFCVLATLLDASSSPKASINSLMVTRLYFSAMKNNNHVVQYSWLIVGIQVYFMDL